MATPTFTWGAGGWGTGTPPQQSAPLGGDPYANFFPTPPKGITPEQQGQYAAIVGSYAPQILGAYYGPQMDWYQQHFMDQPKRAAGEFFGGRDVARQLAQLDISRRYDIDEPRRNLDLLRSLYEQLYGNQVGQENLRFETAQGAQRTEAGSRGMAASGYQETAMDQLARQHGLLAGELGIRHQLTLADLTDKSHAIDKLEALYPLKRSEIEDGWAATQENWRLSDVEAQQLFQLAQWESEMGVSGIHSQIVAEFMNQAINTAQTSAGSSSSPKPAAPKPPAYVEKGSQWLGNTLVPYYGEFQEWKAGRGGKGTYEEFVKEKGYAK